MHIEHNISVIDFAGAISEAVELISPIISNHHKKVTYMAYNIAREMNLPTNEIQDIVLASVLHDIGAFSLDDHINMQSFDVFETVPNDHATSGYKLLRDFAPLANAAKLILFHHAEYDKSRRDVPFGSHIIHLADRMVVMFNERREVFEQIPGVMLRISQKHASFHPLVLEALRRLSKKEYLWIEAFSPSFNANMIKRISFTREITSPEALRSFAKIVAHIIDFRSRFTATHSSGVAAVASELTAIAGFSERECKLTEIAGWLHDLGKLAVPNYILEKNGALDKREINVIKKHTYYTFAILSKIKGLEHIAALAAHHHERLDGNGYPFHIKEDNFTKSARIMAVADIMTALTEDRPYRSGMDREDTMRTLLAMAENGGVDKEITELADGHFTRINDVRAAAQSEARSKYEAFKKTDVPFSDEMITSQSRVPRAVLYHPARQIPVAPYISP